MAASRARTASRLLLQAPARTSKIVKLHRCSREEDPSPRLARADLCRAARYPRTTGLYANLLASSVVKQSKIVDIRRLYEPTLKFEGTRGYLHTIEHRWLERIAGACSLGPYAVLLARPLKEHFVRKTRLVWSAVAAAARARRSGELEESLGCWKGGLWTP